MVVVVSTGTVVTVTVVGTVGSTTSGAVVGGDGGGPGDGPGAGGSGGALEGRAPRTGGAAGAVVVVGIVTRRMAGGAGARAVDEGPGSTSRWSLAPTASRATTSEDRRGWSAKTSNTVTATAAPATRGRLTNRRRRIATTTAPARTSAIATPR
jgi:hypothetical protein